MSGLDTQSDAAQSRLREIFQLKRKLSGFRNSHIQENWPTQVRPAETHISGWITGSRAPMSDATVGGLRQALQMSEQELIWLLQSQEPVEILLRAGLNASPEELAQLMAAQNAADVQRLSNQSPEASRHLAEAQEALDRGDRNAFHEARDKARKIRLEDRDALEAKLQANRAQEVLELSLTAQDALAQGLFEETIDILSEALRCANAALPDLLDDLEIWRLKVVCLEANRREREGALAFLDQRFDPPLRKSAFVAATKINKARDYAEATLHYEAFFAPPQAPSTPGFFGTYLNRTPTFREAQRVWAEIPEDKKNSTMFGTYLNKAKTFEEAKEVWESVPEDKKESATYGTYLNKAKTFEDAKEVWAEIPEDKKESATYGTYLNKAKTFEDAKEVWAEIPEDKKESSTYGTYLNKAKTFEDAKEVWESVPEDKKNSATYGTYLNKAKTFEEAKEVWEGVPEDKKESATYGTYLNKAKTFEDAKEVWAEIPEDKKESSTYGTYLNKAKTFEDAKEVWESVPEDKKNSATYGTYLNKAKTFEEAKEVWEGVPEDKKESAMFGTYLNKAKTLEDAKVVWESVPEDKKESAMFGTFLNKAKTFEEAKEVWEGVPEDKKNSTMFGTYLNKAKTFEEAKEVWESVPEDKKNSAMFGTYLDKAVDFPGAFHILQILVDGPVVANNIHFDLVLRHASTEGELRKITKLMSVAGLTPDIIFYTNLVRQAGELSTAMLYYREARRQDLPFDPQFVMAMIKLERSPKRIRAILKQFETRHSVRPNHFHFTYLISQTDDPVLRAKYQEQAQERGSILSQ